MKGFKHFAVAIFIISSLISCGGGSGGVPSADTTPPTVTFTPNVGPEIKVPVTSTITATYNKNMKASSVENGFIVVPNNGSISFDSSTNTAKYNPNIGVIQGNTQYTITLKNSIKGISGNSL